MSKNINKLLEFLFKENPEASEDDLFGKYLFADPKHKVRKNIPSETNTTEEEEFLSALLDHYDNNDDQALGSMAPKVFELINAGKYTDILKPDQEKTVYRIINVPRNADSLIPFIGNLNPKDVFEKVMYAKEYKIDQKGILKPNNNNGIQSWTYSRMILFDFSSDYNMNIIFYAKPINNKNTFFMNPNNIRKNFNTKYAVAMGSESEVISYGDVVYDGCYIFRDSDFFKLK